MQRDEEGRPQAGRSDETHIMGGGTHDAPHGDPGARRGAETGEGIRVRREGVVPQAASTAEGEDRVRAMRDPWAVRAEDTEPYVGLQYVARLFKIVAMVVIVALSAEVVAGIAYEGAGAILQLFTEVIQGGVLAAMLWGASDLTLLFIDVGHDVRAARVLLGRLSARATADYAQQQQRKGGLPEDEV